MIKRRIYKGKVQSYVPKHKWSYVPKHKWSLGKTGIHPGYWRKKRPKGKKKIKDRPIYARIDLYKDEYGQLRPERKWTIIKRRNV